MIISASRRTDIPAFYSEWLMERLRDGWFIRVNPFQPKQQKRISLKPEAVDVIVFWSKYPRALLRYLPDLDRMGYRYYFQYTLNHYPEFVEPGVPDLVSRIDCFKRLSDWVGPERVIWRYDPIIISGLTGVEYHTRQFESLAVELSAYTRRVMISFLDIYPKLRPRLAKLRQKHGMEILDICNESVSSMEYGVENGKQIVFELAGKLETMAAAHSLEIYTCAEKIDLAASPGENHISRLPYPGIQHGGCIDIRLINRIFGLNLKTQKDRSQRKECLCAAAVDMGAYNTCRFHCVYCYANNGRNFHGTGNGIFPGQ